MNNLMISITVGTLVLVGVLIAYQGQKDNDVAVSNTTSSQTNENAQVVQLPDIYSQDIYTTEPTDELPSEIIEALNKAIMDEYLAQATYSAVLDELGQNTRPFSNIISAEESHVSMLKYLYDKYNISVPEDTLLGNVEVEDTKAENCQIGVEAEIANIALYREQLLPLASDYPDITDTFTRLMNASQDKHLPAFEGCAG